MTLDDIVLNDKAKVYLKDNSRFVLTSGPTGTGKTFLTILKTYLKIINSKKGHDTFAIVCESIVTAEKMFVDDSASIFNIMPNCQYVSGKKPHIRVQTLNGLKKVYLGGYGTARDWKKILGLNLHGIHIEEGTIAHDDFIREAFVRVSRLVTKPFMYVTTNGGTPDQILYTEFFDKSYYDIEYNKNIPTQERLALKQSDKKFKYWYWGFEDSATLTQEEIDDLFNLFPVGSFFYNSKILGIRGYLEGAIYAEYMSHQNNIVDYDLITSNETPYPFFRYTIGIDVGATDFTVVTLTGFTVGYKEAIVIDYVEVNKSGVDEIWEMIKGFINKYYAKIGTKIYGVYIDSAAQILKLSLQNRLHNEFLLQIVDSFKFTIKERVEWGIRFLYQGRLKFSTKAEPIYNSFTKAIYTKNTKATDIREFIKHLDKDRIDSAEYSITPFIREMLRRVV